MESGRRGVGVIESIGTGFALVHRWPFLFVLPILVDAFLWLAPTVSPRPVFERLVDRFGALTEGGGALGESEAVREQVVQTLETLQGANLLGVLSWQVPTFLHPMSPYRFSQAELFAVSSWGQGSLGVLALSLVSVLLACFYLGPIAQGVRGHPLRPGPLLAQTPRLWRRLTTYLALVIGLALVTVPAVGLGWVLFQTLHPFLGGLFLALVLSGGIVASICLFLAKPAIFLEGLGAVAALRRSVTLTYRHFWSVLGLFLLVNLISLGVGLLLGGVAAFPLGLLLAMVGNAYLATGLSAAVMVYYGRWVELGSEEQGS